MAILAEKPKVTVEFNLLLNEEEARALYALTAYGSDSLIKVFYEHLGKAELQPHEKGLITLFQGVRTLYESFERMKLARSAFNQK